mmetsp:Transcript_8129/g.12292  ORF Transcript_8129/g.12292 Transcript_8129/m.12292 type:complete len:287 (-) Transcript_8129:383-1243(-)
MSGLSACSYRWPFFRRWTASASRMFFLPLPLPKILLFLMFRCIVFHIIVIHSMTTSSHIRSIRIVSNTCISIPKTTTTITHFHRSHSGTSSSSSSSSSKAHTHGSRAIIFVYSCPLCIGSVIISIVVVIVISIAIVHVVLFAAAAAVVGIILHINVPKRICIPIWIQTPTPLLSTVTTTSNSTSISTSILLSRRLFFHKNNSSRIHKNLHHILFLHDIFTIKKHSCTRHGPLQLSHPHTPQYLNTRIFHRFRFGNQNNFPRIQHSLYKIIFFPHTQQTNPQFSRTT